MVPSPHTKQTSSGGTLGNKMEESYQKYYIIQKAHLFNMVAVVRIIDHLYDQNVGKKNN